jgi:hypothetical protein
MLRFKQHIIESAASDRYEKEVADSINKMGIGFTAERPKVSTKYSDVLLSSGGGEQSWMEVKMNHTDNLANPRIYFNGSKWATTYSMKSAHRAVELMNQSDSAKQFMKNIAEFSGIKNPTIPTTKKGLKDKNAVPLSVMKEFFAQPGINRYLHSEADVDLGEVITDHYLNNKAEPAYYMQAGDDFYLVSKTNPLKLKAAGSIPILSGRGPFRVRISTRSAFYEVQAELKITKMPDSKYSLMPGSRKKNPLK